MFAPSSPNFFALGRQKEILRRLGPRDVLGLLGIAVAINVSRSLIATPASDRRVGGPGAEQTT